MPEAKDGAPVGRYLVDDVGKIKYLVDPGIGGTVTEVDGKPVTKLDAPKARLFSLIVDGILTQKLPWGLVLIGVFLALMMELVGVSALPFAVGAYLPLSTSTPIMIGGAIRWLVDRRAAVTGGADAHAGPTDAHSEFSPGILLASGLIAGGSIAGVIVAGLAGAEYDKLIDLGHFVPFLAESDAFAMIPFLALAAALYWIGRQAPPASAP
jgi:hypothetical protein